MSEELLMRIQEMAMARKKLEQQLTDCQKQLDYHKETIQEWVKANDKREKQIVMLRDALIYCKTAGIRLANVDDALAATADLEGLVLCDAVPVGHFWQNEETGQIGTVDIWQVQHGYFDRNRRLIDLGPVFRRK